MLHVTFRMSADAMRDRTKTETRRFWKGTHAAKFRPGVKFCATDGSLRQGGQRICVCEVEKVTRERLCDMTRESEER